MPGPTTDDLSTRISIGIAQEQVHTAAAASREEIPEGSLKYHLILWWSEYVGELNAELDYSMTPPFPFRLHSWVARRPLLSHHTAKERT
jgi:hypothetical protein